MRLNKGKRNLPGQSSYLLQKQKTVNIKLIFFLVFSSLKLWWSFLYSAAHLYLSSCRVLQNQLFGIWRCWNSLSCILRTGYTNLTVSEQYYMQSVCTTKAPENTSAAAYGTPGAGISQITKILFFGTSCWLINIPTQYKTLLILEVSAIYYLRKFT